MPVATHLYTRRDPLRPAAWRLAWLGEDGLYVMAEGECSAVYYATRRDARAAGLARFGETARDWPRDAA